MKQLSTEEFEALIKDKEVKLLDVREKYEFAKGHIKGALLVPATDFWENFNQLKIKKTDKIALYCRSGGRSDFIASELEAIGYTKVYNLEMGLLDWLDNKREIVNG
ncbi:MAG TPA: rhodanese-like domain-containing protein [Candidatus Moranbacteria bacterium]|nr:rhodanese-like domain-containing protein [Candidatus Moranbacteria bacterium]